MSIDLTEPTAHIGKRKNRSELFVKGLFDENDFPPGHKQSKTHREVKCLNCNCTWARKIGDSSTSNLWRHLENHHQDKDPRSKKANLTEGQSTLDAFVSQIEVPSKVSIGNLNKLYNTIFIYCICFYF